MTTQMSLPVNIPEILKIATDMKSVRDTPISVSILIDSTASGELCGHVRSRFASEAANTRVRINYLDDITSVEAVHKDDDIAVIVAGEDTRAGSVTQAFRKAGVAVLVVSEDDVACALLAEESGCAIPKEDIISSKKPDFDERMGKWIIAVSGSKKDLAFAYSFPFVRRPLALESITATSMQNAAVGFVPFLPGADMPIMTLNQIKMTLQIATAYGQNIDKERAKEIIAVVGGAFACRQVVRSVTKLVPAVGWLVSGAMGFAATEAMGRALLEYFEAGGDIVGVASVLQSAKDVAVDVTKTATSSKTVKDATEKVRSLALRGINGK